MRDLSNAVRLASLTSTLLVLVAVLSPIINDDSDGYLIMFSWHPVFMTIGVVFLLTQGIVSYITSFGKRVDTHFPDRKSRRVLHGSCQLFAIAFVILGFLTALSTHSVTGRSNLGGGPVTQAYSVHTWLGYVSMVFLLGQMAAGLKKFVVKTRDDKNSASWHGVLGPLVYVFAMATSIAGFNALLPDRTLWRIVVSISLSVTALLTVLFVFYGPAEVRPPAIDEEMRLEESNSHSQRLLSK